MSALYQCIICQHASTSIINLHNHHVQYHSPEELSQTIINLQGFNVSNNMNDLEKKYLKPIEIGDNNNNNNENLYKHVITTTEVQNNNRCNNNRISNSVTLYEEENMKFGHDKTSCLTKCSQFIAWEHELNKRKEINDEEFFNIIEQFCYDLGKKKRRGRKRKTEVNSVETKGFVKNFQNENMVTHNEVINKYDTVPSQVSITTSSWNIKNLTTNNVSDDNVFNLEMKKEGDTINNDSITLPLANIDTNKNILIYDPISEKFSWNQ